VHFPSREEFITLEEGKLRRADVWLDQRAWETIFHLKEQGGEPVGEFELKGIRRLLAAYNV